MKGQRPAPMSAWGIAPGTGGASTTGGLKARPIRRVDDRTGFQPFGPPRLPRPGALPQAGMNAGLWPSRGRGGNDRFALTDRKSTRLNSSH